jgi:hypothetical protein
MDEATYIYTLPLYVSIKGKKSIGLHFSNSNRLFNIKCKAGDPKLNISLIGPDGLKKEFDFNIENTSINGRGYDLLKIENQSDGDILVALEKEY